MERHLDLDLPRQPILRQAPLRLVICQWRYPKIDGLGLDRAQVRPFARSLSAEYPTADIGTMQSVGFQVSQTGIQPLPASAQEIYTFQSDDGAWKVTLTDDWVGLETSTYQGFNDFIDRWLRLAQVAREHFAIERELRLGIRYVNQLEMDSATTEELRRKLSPATLGPFELDEEAEGIERSWQEVRFQHGDSRGFTMQHGFAQNTEQQWVYILDFDAYREQQGAVDLDDQARSLAELNHRVFSLFRKSVTEEAFAAFDPADE